MKPVIGILGGMGPRATVVFEQMLLERLNGMDQNLPTIVTINDGSIPDRSKFLLGRGLDPVPQLKRNLKLLEQMGASIVCLPCNTACAPAIFNRLTPQSNLLNLPNEVQSVMVRAKVMRVFVLATEGTIKAKVYQNACKEIDVACVLPTPSTQRLVSKVIRLVKQNQLEAARITAARIAHIINLQKCDGVILGCTELPLVSSELVPETCLAIDTLEVLADACVQYVEESLKGDRDATRRIYA